MAPQKGLMSSKIFLKKQKINFAFATARGFQNTQKGVMSSKKLKKTRMHSSRMRTGGSVTISRGGGNLETPRKIGDPPRKFADPPQKFGDPP